MEGANPKETTSANESYSTPNLLDVLVNRATFPSMASRKAASTMSQLARAKSRLLITIMTERKPQNILPTVKKLGTMDLENFITN